MDRNPGFAKFAYGRIKSLSARRAWIEIIIFSTSGSVAVSLSARRAWIEMTRRSASRTPTQASLSARRAWIEISGPLNAACIWVVALRKESVDRNKNALSGGPGSSVSLSARRAWIEISTNCKNAYPYASRSPQGERG